MAAANAAADGLPLPEATATATAAATTAAATDTTPTSRLPLLGSPASADSCGGDPERRPSPSPPPMANGDQDARPPPLPTQHHRPLPPATPPPPPPHNSYWEHSRPLRARVAADDGTRLYYEVHGLNEATRRALQRRAGPVPRPACWSAAGYFAQSSGGARDEEDEEDDRASPEPGAGKRAGGLGGVGGVAAAAAAAASTAAASTAAAAAVDDPDQSDPRPRVLLIMGLACGASAWRWTVPDLVSPLELPPGAPAPMVVAALDNRGCGSSDAPRDDQKRYSTELMAADARRVLEDLGWWHRRDPSSSSSSPSSSRARPVHIVGFSMGGMIAMKLAASVALAPDPLRHAVASLTVLSASGGGVETIPWRSLRGLRTAACIALARSPEAAAEATLGMHFARRTLRAPVPHHSPTPRGGRGGGDDGDDDEEERAAQEPDQPPSQAALVRRFELLRREYLVRSSSSQPAQGFSGQLRACWRHRFSEEEARAVRRAHFPLLVLHGRRDLLAAPALGERLARRLRCPSVHLEGAHFIVRECAAQVNALLVAVALAEGGGAGVAAASAAAAALGSPAAAASPAVVIGSPPPGLPRFARAPREAQATWHLEPSPVVQAMWSDKSKGGKEESGGVRRRAKAENGTATIDEGPRVTARAL